MPHLFLNTPSFNGNDEYFTNSGILKTPYQPKVLIVGTYNEANVQGNIADFFYGRNYFWPVMHNLANNLAIGNINQLKSSRKWSLIAGVPNPNLNQILNICKQFKLTFADLVQDVLVPLINHDDIYINNAVRNGQAVDNVTPIIEFLNNNPSIEYVYCTTKFGNLKLLLNLWNSIQAGVNNNVTFGFIRTPSGRGRFSGSAASGIAKHWVWCNHPNNPHGQLQNSEGYTHFDHNWLINSGVDVNLF